MNTSTRITSFTAPIRRWLSKPAFTVALLGSFAIAIGAMAQGTAGVGMHHCGDHAMTASSENMVAHVNGMLQYIYAEVGATDAQKAQLAAIVQQATTDLAPLHQQLDGGHAQVFSLLTQDHIDRAALETARAAHISAADQASRRVTQFVADVAEVLTPVQRKALATHMAQHTS